MAQHLQTKPAYSVLSIDGGGIRGIIPGVVLQYLEEETGMAIADLFDLIAGTSTGGMLACGLTVKGEDGKPKYKATDLLPLYTGDDGKKIFSMPKIGGLLNGLRNVFQRKFNAENMDAVLQAKYGEARLADAYTDLLITAYDTEQKLPFYLRSSEARLDPENENFKIWEIARATGAAPTYFSMKKIQNYNKLLTKWTSYPPPFKEDDLEGKEEALKFMRYQKKLSYLALVDGGLFANNPSMVAYVEAMKIWKASDEYKEMMGEDQLVASPGGAKGFSDSDRIAGSSFEPPIFLLSIGTGQSRKPYEYQKAKNWGIVKWAQPVVDILMQGVSEYTDEQMRHILPPFNDANRTPRYIRINIELDRKHSSMDDASDLNTSRLRDYYGKKIVEYNKPILDQAVKTLKEVYMVRRNRG